MNVKRLIPEFLEPPLRGCYRAARYRMPSPIAAHFCPVCQTGLRRFSGVRNGDTTCIFCKSVARHRMVWSFFTRHTDLLDGRKKRLLHIAPEGHFEITLSKALGDGYVTADLLRSDVRVRMDITQIPCRADSFDVVYCSHVLEHVPNDRQAMRELARVLKPNGWAVLMVPLNPEIKTFEDLSITDPADRLKFFLQEDHVRLYGNDFPIRLNECGLDVRTVRKADFLTRRENREIRH